MWVEKLKVQKTNKLQRLYPTTKLLIVVLYTVCTLVVGSVQINGLPLLVIPFFLTIPILFACSGSMDKFVRSFGKVFFIAILIFVVQTFLVNGGRVFWSWGVLSIHEQGLRTGISLAFSICNIAGIFVWLFQTTTNEEIARALENSGMNYKATYVFLSTLQMVEVLGHNSKTIMNAQRARGVETEGNLLVRAKAFFPTLVPLILTSIISMEERVLTLESKGFDVDCKKQYLFQVEPSGYEKTAVTVSVMITLIIVGGRIVLWMQR